MTAGTAAGARAEEDRCVLLVDDEPGVRAVLRDLLAAQGFEPCEADDGEQGWEVYRDRRPALVVSDLQMPRLDGLGLLRRIRDEGGADGTGDDETAFILLTGAGTLEAAVGALRSQADDYLVKPFDVRDVLHAVDRAVEHRRLVRENRFYQQHLEKRVAAQARQLESVMGDALRTLAVAIEMRDDYTGGHVERVARYAVATGREMGMGAEELRHLWIGALLHDVGKIAVPDDILKKQGPLTDDEYEVMKAHPEIGADIVQRSDFLKPALPAVLHHQERWDGAGYPAGLGGEEISLAGRIISVVDTFDAISTSRPYRDARSDEEALAELRRCAGTQFDPRVVEAFARVAAKGFPGDAGMPPLSENGAGPG